jgi:selenocysteine lyase/cysteine desulfurase
MSDAQPEELPERLESGTLNVIGLAGLHAALEFLQEIGLNRLRAHERDLLRQLLEGLHRIPAARLFGTTDPARHGGALSFTLDGLDPATVGYRLDNEFDIGVRVGLHCAPDAHRTIGTFPEGTIRVSPGWFNTPDDIERLLAAVAALVAGRTTSGQSS